MADFAAMETAFIARAESVVVATTGAIDLEAIASGYTRTTGSFLTDGFDQGMEVTVSGFAANTTNVIQSVATLTLTMLNAVTPEASASGRTLSVTLPALRATDDPAFEPIQNRPYVKLSLVTGPSTLRAGPAQNGVVEDTGLFVVNWYALAGAGTVAVRRSVQALKALFTPGTYFLAGADTVRIRTDVATTISPLRSANGWTLCSLQIPYRVHSTNVVVS